MKLPKLIVLLLTAIVVLGLITSCQPTEEDLLKQVMDAGKLVVSTDPNYAPQSFLNDQGEMDGFDVDVSKEVARRLGVELEFTTPDWDMITAGSWGGRWDLSIGSMTITENRMEVLWFTQPYYFTPASVAVHVDNTDIQKVEDLAGKTIGVCSECTYDLWLRGTLRIIGEDVTFPDWEADIVTYETDHDAFADLVLGDGERLDAVISAQPTLVDAIANGCEAGCPFRLVGDPVFYEPLSFSLDKSRGMSEEMLARLDQILTDMHGDGTLTELSIKWYGVDISKRAEE